MKLSKLSACAVIFTSALSAQAQNSEPVIETRYKAFIESDYGVELDIKPQGKAALRYLSWDDSANKMSAYITNGTWTQQGDTVTFNFKDRKYSKMMKYQIRKRNDPTSIQMECKGPYGLWLLEAKGSQELLSEQQLWIAKLVREDGPCVK